MPVVIFALLYKVSFLWEASRELEANGFFILVFRYIQIADVTALASVTVLYYHYLYP